MSQRRKAVIFPKEKMILQQLGENIRLAMKRRRITQTMIAERTGISKPTLRNIERGESTVSIGHYLRVLAVLRLAEDLAKVALDDELGRKLQDIELLKTTKSGTKPTPMSSDKPHRPKSERSEYIKSLMAKARSPRKNEHDSRHEASSNGDDA